MEVPPNARAECQPVPPPERRRVPISLGAMDEGGILMT